MKIINDEAGIKDLQSAGKVMEVAKMCTTEEQKAMLMLTVRLSSVEIRRHVAEKKGLLNIMAEWIRSASENKDTDLILAVLDCLKRVPCHRIYKESKLVNVFKDLRKYPDDEGSQT